jgi:pyruvate dehydrogenase phosphatase
VITASWVYLIWPKSDKKGEPLSALPDVSIKSKDIIDTILHQKEITLSSKISKTSIHFNQVPSNAPIEDYHCEHKLKNGSLIALFDGHGGPECAALLKKYLPTYISQNIEKAQPPSVTRSEHISSALRQSFIQLDRDIMYYVI